MKVILIMHMFVGMPYVVEEYNGTLDECGEFCSQWIKHSDAYQQRNFKERKRGAVCGCYYAAE